MSLSVEGKRILIIGGSGSLGHALVDRYLTCAAQIVICSRDECKHWAMEIEYGHPPNLSFMIGDMRDKDKMREVIRRAAPHIVIIAAAMKHVDRCENDIHEAIGTNMLGVKHVLDVIEDGAGRDSLETVLFVSTDKACSPVNVYGMCKAIGEALMVEKARLVPSIKFVTVRYGNVLNSRGSIIPLLHKMGKDPNVASYCLTNDRMTRFIMTLEEAVDLIHYALTRGESGDIVIPVLEAMRIKDLMEIFSEVYGKPVVMGALRPGEKVQECLINETQLARTVSTADGKYYSIKPTPPPPPQGSGSGLTGEYHSGLNLLDRDRLWRVLRDLKLIS